MAEDPKLFVGAGRDVDGVALLLEPVDPVAAVLESGSGCDEAEEGHGQGDADPRHGEEQEF